MVCGEPFYADDGNRKTFIVRCRRCHARSAFCDSSEPVSILPPDIRADLWFRDHMPRSVRQRVDFSSHPVLEVERGRESGDDSDRTQSIHKTETGT